MYNKMFTRVVFLLVILTAGLTVSAQQTQGQAPVARVGKGGVIITNPDGTKVNVPASALGQLQVQTQTQSGTNIAGTVPVNGPVTPMNVEVTPGDVRVNSVNAVGTTSISVPVTEVETKTTEWDAKTRTWKDCKGKPHSRTTPGGSRTEIVGTKTTDKVVTGTVQVDLTPAVQQAVGVSKEYTDQQMATFAAQINAQRQTATIAVPIYSPPQQTQSQSQSQVAITRQPEKKKGGCRKKCKAGYFIAGVVTGIIIDEGIEALTGDGSNGIGPGATTGDNRPPNAFRAAEGVSRAAQGVGRAF
jgi:hypothetical protein